jgi:hypothetical protein
MILTETQRAALIKEIEANYCHNERDLFELRKDDIRMAIYNYDTPMYSQQTDGNDLRIFYGLVRLNESGKRQKTLLGTINGVIVSECFSVEQAKIDLESIISSTNDIV